MHVIFLSDHETQGGAAVAAGRLADSLSAAGHRVTRIVAFPDGHPHRWTTRTLNPAFSAVSRLMRRAGLRSLKGRYDSKSAPAGLRRLLGELKPDAVIVHNIHGALPAGWSMEMIGVCLDHAPTVWAAHDMWSVTGRCAYSYDCRKFHSGCDADCPTADEYPALAPDEIRRAWDARKTFFEKHPRLVAVAPSEWLRKELKAGLLSDHRIERIPYGLPLDVFRPLDKTLAKRALGVDSRKPALLVSACDLRERRKGGSLLAAAAEKLPAGAATWMMMGEGELPMPPGRDVRRLGFLSDDVSKVLAYNAADYLVHPAPVDNLPNVVMEALACGLPVAAFPAGGVPEMVRPGRTGFLAGEISAAALAAAIGSALKEESAKAQALAGECRLVAETEYAAEMQAARYGELFKSIA